MTPIRFLVTHLLVSTFWASSIHYIQNLLRTKSTSKNHHHITSWAWLHYQYTGRTEGLWRMCRHRPVTVPFISSDPQQSSYGVLRLKHFGVETPDTRLKGEALSRLTKGESATLQQVERRHFLISKEREERLQLLISLQKSWISHSLSCTLRKGNFRTKQ